MGCNTWIEGAGAAPESFRRGSAALASSPQRQRGSVERAQCRCGGHVLGLTGAEAGQVDPTGMWGDCCAAGRALGSEGAALRRLFWHALMAGVLRLHSRRQNSRWWRAGAALPGYEARGGSFILSILGLYPRAWIAVQSLLRAALCVGIESTGYFWKGAQRVPVLSRVAVRGEIGFRSCQWAHLRDDSEC